MTSSKSVTQGALGSCDFLNVCSRNAPLLFSFNSFEEQEIVIVYWWHMNHGYLRQAKERDVFDGPPPPHLRAPPAAQSPCSSWVRAHHSPMPARKCLGGLRFPTTLCSNSLCFCLFQVLISDKKQKVN